MEFGLQMYIEWEGLYRIRWGYKCIYRMVRGYICRVLAAPIFLHKNLNGPITRFTI